MSTPPAPPPKNPAAARGSRPSATPQAGPSAGRRSRKPVRIRYEPIKIEEPHWGRWMVVGLGGVAIVIGVVGWYQYVAAPRGGVEPPTVVSRSATPASSDGVGTARAADTPSASRDATDTGPSPLPELFSAKELHAVLRAHSDARQLFERQYRDREVTWSGTVTSTSRVDNLLGIEFKDSDGMRILAWCPADGDAPGGTSITVHARLTRKREDGFVLDRCELR